MRTELNKLRQGDIVTFYYYEMRITEWALDPNGRTIKDFVPKVWTHRELKATKFWYLGTFELNNREAKNIGSYGIYKLFCDENDRYIRIFSDDWDKKLNIHEDSMNYRHSIILSSEELILLEDLLNQAMMGSLSNYMEYKDSRILRNRIRYLSDHKG